MMTLKFLFPSENKRFPLIFSIDSSVRHMYLVRYYQVTVNASLT